MLGSASLASRLRWSVLDGTTALGTIWVFNLVYWHACSSDRFLPVTTWLSSIIILLVVSAAVDRRRWGRLAMMGISGIILADALLAAVRLTLSPASEAATLQVLPFYRILLRSYGGGELYGALVLLICVLTIAWFLLPSVRRQFEERKRASMRSFQFYIAASLLVVMAFGVARNGALYTAKALEHGKEAHWIYAEPFHERRSVPLPLTPSHQAQADKQREGHRSRVVQ